MEFNWKEVDIDEIILKCIKHKEGCEKCINNTREYKFKFSNLKNDLTIPTYCTKQSLTECLHNLKKIISNIVLQHFREKIFFSLYKDFNKNYFIT
jgi:hypothetical protein